MRPKATSRLEGSLKAHSPRFSYHMLLGTHLILNRSEKPECFHIFPFALSLANRRPASQRSPLLLYGKEGEMGSPSMHQSA